jgi:hypothetical protein
MTLVLALKHLKPVAVGHQRYVFVHPDDPQLIVKVPTERYVARRSGARGRRHKRWVKRYVRARHHEVFLRELREQLALRAAAIALPRYVQTIVGFVETDLGMGLVSRAVTDRRGGLAPSLSLLAAQGQLTGTVRRHLDEFFAWFLDSPVVVGDLNAGNLVYGFDAEHGDHFVIIDGLGDKNIIPFSSLSRRLNRWGKKRRVRRIKTEIARIEAKYSGQLVFRESRWRRRNMDGLPARPLS